MNHYALNVRVYFRIAVDMSDTLMRRLNLNFIGYFVRIKDIFFN